MTNTLADDARPILCSWDGESFAPASPYWQRQADEAYTVGETYRLAPYEERSWRSHQHYFACINDVWQNLPEHLVDQYPTSEKLRKHALIKTGYHDSRSVACASAEEAERVAAFIRPIDDYAVVTIRDNVVTIYTAKSQSMRAMGKATFQKSKDDVLGILANMIGVNSNELRKNAGEAA